MIIDHRKQNKRLVILSSSKTYFFHENLTHNKIYEL
jgi:hypothetical protein